MTGESLTGALLTEYVVGFRQWLAIPCGPPAGYRLCPLFTCTLSAPWVPGVNTARCFPSRSTGHQIIQHEPPGPDGDDGCPCGLYARHEITDTMRRDHIKGRITGAIQAWGDIEVHNDGFRAQHARVIALARSSDHREQLAELGPSYGVKVLPLDHLAGYASLYGTPIPPPLIPIKAQPAKKAATDA